MHRNHSRFALYLLVVLLAVSAQAQPKRQQDAYFDAENVRTPIAIIPNRIGVMLREGVRAERLAPLFKSIGATISDRYENAPLVLIAVTGTPETLSSIARKLKTSSELIVAAGLPITVNGSKTPALIADEIVARFPRGIDADKRAATLAALGLRIVMADPFTKGQFLLRIGDDPKLTTLDLANRLRDTKTVDYAFPNFYSVAYNLETIPNDTMFGSQWHLRNTGASGGTATADSRATLAWDITQGAAGTLIAIHELFGFDVAHEDLAANLNANGFNFNPCNANPMAGCGNNDVTPSADDDNNAHATQVAGVAAARSNNNLGVSGGCPQCTFLPIVSGNSGSDFGKNLAFAYANTQNAQIVTNSWGGGGPFPTTTATINDMAANGRGGLGTLVFFSAGNSPVDTCTGASQQPLASLASVISISSSSNTDRKVLGHAHGDCIGILSPTRWGAQDPPGSPTGTLAVATTDRTGAVGANSNHNDCIGGLVMPANLNYTNCFSGTSSAAPLAASIAALALTANANLTRIQVRNLLQDTADKIEDSTGTYAEATGFSSPAGSTGTHGFGRINAFEAVRVVAASAQGGKDGVDVFIRDNRLDWGNTDHPSNTLLEPVRGFIPHWHSVDVKVDAPPYQSAPANNAQFEAFTDENPQSGQLNKVYVRVRNRGPVTAASVTVKLHWAFAGAGLPALPADFWTAFPADSADTTIWHPLGTQAVTNLAYSGASVANTGGDAAQIVEFDFPGPAIDNNQPAPHHFCVFAVLDSAQDHAGPKAHPPVPNDFIPDVLTPTDNNVTHRNLFVEGLGGNSDFADRFYVVNPFNAEAVAILNVVAPRGLQVDLSPIKAGERRVLKPHERVLVTIKLAKPKEFAEISIVQRTTAKEQTVSGGFTYRFGEQKLPRPRTIRYSKPGQLKIEPVENTKR
ncbi:MAG: cell wall-associated protease [Thermoanaerobaculia bacterium]|jgi:hypothetical protein|nr:cell wall-associated protease [Thermoanaerobaculia bacterium]